ncbi:methyltransferase type 11 [Microthyrium microscopicum]|uniref:Methyltransferase type 11 n=1 Tax=Microthyrium microscopicum TaxID=703497 RepID=A0A6A6UBZ5_9PEZI|nr:methyltransferase type 11 [Microthyrium microscopicum]
MDPSTIAAKQCLETSDNLTTRIAIHSYSTNPQSWFSWLSERLTMEGHVFEALEIGSAEVRQCDAAQLPFLDHHFDMVIANSMLYHVDDLHAVLAEFARVLRRGGKLIVSLSGRDANPELSALSINVGRPALALKQARIFAENAGDLLGRYFVDVKSERFPGDVSVPTAEPVLAYLNSMDTEEMSAKQTSIARGFIEGVIGATGNFKNGKHTVLFTATGKRQS